MSDDPRDKRIAELEAQLREALALIEELRQENRRLRERLEELEQAAARQAAPFRRPEAKKVPAEQRKKPGRKPGHPGAFRAAPEQIDEVIDLPLDHCPGCGGSVTQVRVIEQIIEEIPPIRPRVYKLITRRGTCGCCGKMRTTHPLITSDAGGCAGVQIGPRALALAASLNKVAGLTLGTTKKVLDQLCGLRVSRGGLCQAMHRLAERVEGDYEQLIHTLRHEPAVNADETSWWVGGPGHWLWTFTTPTTTLYTVGNRSAQVIDDILGDDFAGVLVSDCLASYDRHDCRKHKCFAHHLRAIRAAEELDTAFHVTLKPRPSPYLREWRGLFQAAAAVWRTRDQIGVERFALYRSKLEGRKDQLLDQPVTRPGEVKVRNRLIKHRPHLLRCLEEPAAEPTNNRAERALRPAVIARKLSCGNKTDRGRRTWQTLASLGVTLNQRGQDLTDLLRQRLPLPAVG